MKRTKPTGDLATPPHLTNHLLMSPFFCGNFHIFRYKKKRYSRVRKENGNELNTTEEC